MDEVFSIKKFYIYYLFTFLILPMGFLIKAFYSRTISIGDFGIIYAVISFFNFIGLFSKFGLTTSLKYYLPKYLFRKDFNSVKNLFYYSLILQFLMVVIFSLIIYFLSSFIAISYFKNIEIQKYLIVFLLYFIFLNFYTSLNDIFISYKLNIYFQSFYFAQLFLTLAFSFFFFFYGFNSLSYYYALSWGIATFTVFLVEFIIIFIKFPYLFKRPNYDKMLLKKYLSYSNYSFLNEFGSNILNLTDILVITYFLSLTSVAYYVSAFTIITSLVTLFGSFTLILMPIVSELLEKKDIGSISRFLEILYGLIFYLILPILLVLVIFSKEFLVIIYGSQYISGYSILVVLAFFSIFKIFMSYNLVLVSGLGLASKLPKIIYPVTILNFLLNIIFLKIFGLIGVAVATIVSWILMVIFTFRIISKKINFGLNIFKFLKIISIDFIFLVLVLLLKNIVIFSNKYLNTFFILSFSFIIYLLIGNFLKIYTFEEIYIFLPKKISRILENFRKNYFSFLK